MGVKKKKNDEDSIVIEVGGNDVVVPRGNLSDEEWAAAREHAKNLQNVNVPTDGTDPEYAKKVSDAKAVSAADEASGDLSKKAVKNGQDFMDVKGPNSQQIRVYRGPLDDAAWNDQIERARKNGHLINSVETVPPEQNVAEKSGGGSGVLRLIKQASSAADKLFEGATPADKGKEIGRKMAAAADPDQPDYAAAEAGKKAAQPLVDIFNEDSVTGDQPTGSKPSMAKKTLGSLTSRRSEKAREVPTVALNKIPEDPELRRLAEEKTDLLDAGLPPENAPPSMLDKVGDGIQKYGGPALSAAGTLLGPLGIPIKLAGDALTPAPPPPAAPPSNAPAVGGALLAGANAGAGSAMAAPSGPPPPSGSSGGSMKMSASGGPPGAGPQIPQMPDREKEITSAFDQASLAQQRRADLESQGLKDQARIQQEGMQHQISAQADMMATQQRLQQAQADGQAAYAKTVSEMQEPAKVDPDHWWNSRNTAQKIFAVLSAGLTKGATLSMFQHAIDRDVEAQQTNISNQRNALQAKGAGQMNIMQMARQNGLDLYEAQKTAKAFAWDQVDRQAKQAALNTSSEVVKANAQEISANAQIQMQKELSGLDQHRQAMALEGEKIRMQDRHNKSMEAAAWTRANKTGAGGPKLQPVRGAMAMELNSMKDALDAAKGYSKEFKEKASGFMSKLTSLDPTNTTDAAKYDSKRMLIVKTMARAIEGYRITDKDMEQYEKLIPKAGDLKGDVQWDAMVKRLQQKLDNNLKGAQAQRFDTGSMDSFAGQDGELSDDETAQQLGFEAD